MTLSNIAGAIAPLDFAGITVPGVAGMKFSAVAEVHSSAVCACRQRNAVVLDPRAAPGNDGRPMEGISVLEPLEHSVLEVALDRGDSLMVKVDVSDPLEHAGLDRADDVVPGLV